MSTKYDVYACNTVHTDKKSEVVEHLY